MKNDLEVILSELRELLPVINKKYGVSSIEVFGSYVKNQQNDKSDLDLLVSFSTAPGLFKFLGLKNFLSEKLNLNVDLVMKDSLKPGIARNILVESVQV
jgi:predicted nucleotidyltransferase